MRCLGLKSNFIHFFRIEQDQILKECFIIDFDLIGIKLFNLGIKVIFDQYKNKCSGNKACKSQPGDLF